MSNNATIVGALAFIFSFAGCGPSPTAVCDRMIELAKKEEGGEGLAKKAEEGRAECISSMESAKEMQGAAKFSEAGNCIMDAATFKDALQCQK